MKSSDPGEEMKKHCGHFARVSTVCYVFHGIALRLRNIYFFFLLFYWIQYFSHLIISNLHNLRKVDLLLKNQHLSIPYHPTRS